MTGNKIDSIDPTDEVLPPRSLVLFGLQHVLVMAASPITAVFLVSKALGFSDALTVSLISATFLICGLGTILQSFGPAGFGARLPFIMVPGGAPIAIFLAIAQQTDVQTAVGAVILTAGFYFLALPVFRRLLRYFPPIVVGTMLLLVSVNLVRIYGGTITGKQGSEGFADPMNVGLALATIALTVIFARVFTGTLQRISVMLGLIAGSAIAIGAGYMDLSGIFDGPVIAMPQLLPFGMPKFDFFAALPLIVFSIISMAGRPSPRPRSSGVGATLTRSCPQPSAVTPSPRSSAACSEPRLSSPAVKTWVSSGQPTSSPATSPQRPA